MIEKLRQSDNRAFGLKVDGELTAEQLEVFVPQIEFAVGKRGHRKIGILADLSSMEGAEWKARWDELHFLKKFAEHIVRFAVVGGDRWEQLMSEILAGTVLIEVETRYYEKDEIHHAWHWVKHGEHPGDVPVRRVFPKEDGVMGGYVPRYLDV
jgi:hypothetical protein